MANIKGNALQGIKLYVQEKHGAAGLEKWLSALPPTEQTILRGLVLPASWYPVGIWHRCLDSYVNAFGRGDPEAFRPVAEFIAANDLTKIFKLLLTLASPAMIVRRAGMLWERYYDVGTLSATELGPTEYLLHLKCNTQQDEGANLIICSVGVPAWLMRAATIAGARNIVGQHQACRFRGAAACEINMRWSA